MLRTHSHPRRLARLAAIAACGLLVPAAAAAAPPLRDRFPVDGEFPWAPMSDACGFPVTLAFSGTFDIRIFTRPDGTLKEIDTQPGSKLTYRSESGEFTAPFSGVLHTTYPQGAVAGAPAYLASTGDSFGAPGFTGPGTGRLVFAGVVEDVEDGFPRTRFTELGSASGNFTDQTARI